MSDRTISLARCLAIGCALILAAFVGVHVLVQALLGDEEPVTALLLHHGWHIALLGILTYAAFYLLLHRIVVDPLHRLYVKLYAMTKGDLRPLEFDSRIAEVKEIADVVSLLLTRPERAIRKPVEVDIRDALNTIRNVCNDRGGHLTPSHRQSLLRSVSRIEVAVDLKDGGDAEAAENAPLPSES